MKFKSIAQICKKSKTAVLCDHSEGENNVSQWVGDGCAIYPIYCLPYLEENNVYTIFDVPKKQWDGWDFKHIEMPKVYCIDDVIKDEYKVEYEGMSITYLGRMLRPLRTQNGLVFIESKYLAPLADVLDVLELYERKTLGGQTYIAAKAGFILQALIMPYDVISKDFVKRLDELTLQCTAALRTKEYHLTDVAYTPEQFTFAGELVDAETGEIIGED